MGTHPIFESDFDCLTEMFNKFCAVGRSSLTRIRPVRITFQRGQSSTVQTPSSVAYWLYGICGATVVAVSLGGVTRLTESVLSMTSWHLIKDITKPTCEEDWIREFEIYKTFPEYEAVHSDMTLEGFKFIYHMEWGHRNWGRGIGVFFALHFIAFMARGKLSSQVKKRTSALLALLCFQGGMGWYMVKSGLVERDDTPVRVSPYRLCAHLSTAFLFLTGSLWTALDISMSNRGGPPALPDHRLTRVLRIKSAALAVFTFIVAMSGAFVAGNDAGIIYGTYPKMDDQWIPRDYCSESLSPVRNMFENGAAVQCNHRILAHLLIAGIGSCWFMARKAGLSGRPKTAINLCGGLVLAQATMGVGCLLYQVPVSLGAAHQLGSVFLLSSATWFAHEMRKGNVQKIARKIK